MIKKFVLTIALLAMASGAVAQTTTFQPFSTSFIPPQGVAGLFSNGTAITSTVPILLPDGLRTAPSLTFSAQNTTGLFRQSTSVMGFAVNSSTVFTVSSITAGPLGLRISDGFALSWSANTTNTAAGDVALWREGSGHLGLRNGTSGQQFSVYGTYTDASNYGRFGVVSTSTGTDLIAQTAGTGTGGLRSIQGSRALVLTDAAVAVSFTRIAVASNGYMGGEMLWVATSTDATDYRSLTGRTRFSFVNKGGTEDCNDVAAIGTDLLSSSNGNTLACTWTGANAAADTCDLQVTCTDNTAGDQTVSIYGTIQMPILGTVTPQT